MSVVDLKLQSRRHEGGFVYTLSFKPTERVVFTAGQYAHFQVPELQRNDLPVRELSFASAPSDDEIAITVNTKSGSAYQQALLSMLPDQILLLFKIKGETTAPDGIGEKVVCIGHGVGMAPFRSIVREKAHRDRLDTITLVHIDRGDFLYQSEFEHLHCAQHRITREEIDQTLEAVIAKNAYARYLIAGAPSFVLDMEKVLHTAGISGSNIRRDVFNGLIE